MEAVTIGISTLANRMHKIALPKAMPGVQYLIMVQGGTPDGILPDHARPDVTYHQLDLTGVAQSRSAVMDHCQTPLLLFMDDDVEMRPEGINAMGQYMTAHPGLSIITGTILHQTHSVSNTAPHALTRWNTARIMTPELMVRVAKIRESNLRFDPDFGINGTYPIGDEFVFVTDLLKKGHSGMRVPIVIGTHDGHSTGDIWADAEMLNARQAVLKRVFGRWAVLVQIGFAIKHRRRLGGWPAAIRFAFGW